MADLEMWLEQATRWLSANSAAQVRREIEEHFDAARDAAMREGLNEADAERAALAALGDARVANRQYRRVMLTKSEARVLRKSAWEADAVCGHGWLRWLVAITAVGTGIVAVWAWTVGMALVTPLLAIVFATGFAMVAAPMFLPLFTPQRGRIYRVVKWVLLAGLLACALGMPRYTWLFVVSFWPTMWIEWKRIAIRRKIPQADWPKHLYL